MPASPKQEQQIGLHDVELGELYVGGCVEHLADADLGHELESNAARHTLAVGTRGET